jgi:hypothetical protein
MHPSQKNAVITICTDGGELAAISTLSTLHTLSEFERDDAAARRRQNGLRWVRMKELYDWGTMECRKYRRDRD